MARAASRSTAAESPGSACIDSFQADEARGWGAAGIVRVVGDLDPKIVIAERFEDYMIGSDLYLEAVLEALR